MIIDMRKCLIVVDYQNDFVSGTLGFPGAVELESNIAAKIENYRKNGDEVIFTFDTHGENYMDTLEGRLLPVAHCLSGTEGHNLYGKIAGMVFDSDKQFIKHTFGSDALFHYLSKNVFESIELVGLVSNICVLANAVLAKTAQHETPVMVDARCTAGADARLHQAALEVMSGLHIEVLR